MRAICKNPVVKQEMEGSSLMGSVPALTAPLAATAVIKCHCAHLRGDLWKCWRWVQSRDLRAEFRSYLALR